MGDDEFVRVKVGRVGSRTIAAPLARGAGVITSMVRADGIIRIPRMSEGLAAGSSVEVEVLTDPAAVVHTAVLIGSHDPALDVLANEVHRRFAPATVASTNVGSQGGLAALRRNNAHAAGCHLIDPATGTYNLVDVGRILPGRDVLLVTFAHRQQGLMVAPGNPRGIRSFEDLLRDDVVFVNRQRGSGTRMLLDYELTRRGFGGAAIGGYDRELYTHVAVAAEVASGGADAGLGVLAAARALNLDFIPLLEEALRPRHPARALRVAGAASRPGGAAGPGVCAPGRSHGWLRCGADGTNRRRTPRVADARNAAVACRNLRTERGARKDGLTAAWQERSSGSIAGLGCCSRLRP